MTEARARLISLGIRFPVLRSFDVLGYGLYPGKDGTGLAHDLPRGVSIIAGINGIGKTTLLNALLRLMIGPWDVLREDPDDIGSTRHELVAWRTPSYFASRVPDGATSATVGGWLTFGPERVYVRRNLTDLSIAELAHNDVALPAKEDVYKALVQRLAGLQDYYDFHFIVRNLLFYLEDRRPLIWADEGQFEIARTLFVFGNDATEISRQYDLIKTVDSRYRNLLTEHNRSLKRLREWRRAAGSAVDTVARLGAAQEAYAGSLEALNRVDLLLDGLIEDERETAEAIRRQQLDVEVVFRDYEGHQQAFFGNAFPQVSETFQYVLSHIVAGGGCLVCGSDAHAKEGELRAKIAAGRCPVCDSPPEEQERMIAASKVAAERVNKAGSELDKRRGDLAVLEAARRRLADRISNLLEERRSVQDALERHRVEVNALQARLPASSGEIADLEASVKVSQKRVDELAKTRADAITSYRGLMSNASAAIQAVHTSVRDNFQRCVQAFLEESCELNFRERSRTVGQSGERVQFPGFDVMLTSATFPDTPTPRRTQDQVSESQKEFIDLAFRIALIRTASADQGAMLVLETPEASLDSLFMYRAGDLLREFAEDGGTVGNVLLASSNLNDANMIPALLGIDRHSADVASISTRMINLLEEAAENAALAKDRPRYQDRYTKAITPTPKRLPA